MQVNNAIAKIDTVTKRCLRWHEPGGMVGEPAFVPRPGATDEDDGAVLSIVTQADGRSALLVLDGATMQEVARATLPYGLPNGFHGCFVPETGGESV